MTEITAGPLGIAILMASVAVAIWWLRRKGFVNIAARATSREMQVLERLPLTPQHSLFLVRAGEERLLLGVSPAGCQILRSPGLREIGRDSI